MDPYTDEEDDAYGLDICEEEIQEGYDEGVALLQSNSPQNESLTFRCIFCNLKRKDYSLVELLHHASVAATTRGSNGTSKKLGQHKALLEWLEDARQQLAPVQPARLLLGGQLAERHDPVFLWPPVAVLVNVWAQSAASDESIKASLLQHYQEFRPSDVKAYFGYGSITTGHGRPTGWAALKFEETLEGLLNVKAFSTYMDSHDLGKKGWRQRAQQGALGQACYGWQAMEEDLHDQSLPLHGGLKELRDLKRYSRLTECKVLDLERSRQNLDKAEFRRRQIAWSSSRSSGGDRTKSLLQSKRSTKRRRPHRQSGISSSWTL